MKKLLLMLTACCLIGGGDLLASAKVAGPKLTITFEFGTNPSLNCPNSGFCRIKAGGSLRGHDGTVGEIQFNEDEGKLELTINTKTGISAEDLKNYFAKNMFRVDADYVFSEEMCELLNIPADFTIKKGNYSVQRNLELLTVQF
jgi:hypothetical protein